MIEILENLDLPSRPNLDLAGVEVNGIALGTWEDRVSYINLGDFEGSSDP
ncbi:hypothetical protein [Streptomyces parvus]